MSDWRSGKAVATRITKADGRPMVIVGLWSVWEGPVGDVHSFTRLTVNATEQALMKNFHKPEDEKWMVVVLPVGAYDDWLNAAPADIAFTTCKRFSVGSNKTPAPLGALGGQGPKISLLGEIAGIASGITLSRFGDVVG